MNIYTNNQFSGFYPVGTAAVIVAPTADIATAILNAKLEAHGLPADAEEIDMELITTDEEGVRILCDGNY